MRPKDWNYRWVFAVASKNSVYIYDTEAEIPLAAVSEHHVAMITDLCWTADGNTLVVASQDGYISYLHCKDILGKIDHRFVDFFVLTLKFVKWY